MKTEDTRTKAKLKGTKYTKDCEAPGERCRLQRLGYTQQGVRVIICVSRASDAAVAYGQHASATLTEG
jgi:hypothetical protein